MITKLKKIVKTFFAKKKPKIRFYTLEPGVLPLFPIIPSSSYKRNYLTFPDPEDSLPIRTCPGILKLTSSGWIVTAPADFIIRTGGDQIGFQWREPWKFQTGSQFPETSKYVSHHAPSQTVPLIDDLDKTVPSVVKIETPWRIDADEDIIFLMLPVAYNNEKRFTAAYGFLDPKYAYNINVQLFWHVLEGDTLVRAGTPLCQIIPMKKRDLSISSYDISIESANDLDIEKEKAFIYASNCVIMEHDKLKSRLVRTSKILDNYKTKG